MSDPYETWPYGPSIHSGQLFFKLLDGSTVSFRDIRGSVANQIVAACRFREKKEIVTGNSSEMVERVARAMYKKCDDDTRRPPWDEVDHAFRNLWLRAARIAIVEMRVPTEAMLRSDTSCGLSLNQGWQAQKELWQRMIDAALK
jgi:hypothetical protein